MAKIFRISGYLVDKEEVDSKRYIEEILTFENLSSHLSNTMEQAGYVIEIKNNEIPSKTELALSQAKINIKAFLESGRE